MTNRPGFTLIEIMIVVILLGILAAIMIPVVVGLDKPANENTLRSQLRTVREQIELFAVRHNGVPPGYPNGDATATPTATAFVAHLCDYTSENGAVSATPSSATPIEPSLFEIPPNPFNHLNAVQVIADSGSIPAADGKTYGWFYKPATRQFLANTPGTDDSGTAYASY